MATDNAQLPRRPPPNDRESIYEVGTARLVGICPECGGASMWGHLDGMEGPMYAFCYRGFNNYTTCSYFELLTEWLDNSDRQTLYEQHVRPFCERTRERLQQLAAS